MVGYLETHLGILKIEEKEEKIFSVAFVDKKDEIEEENKVIIEGKKQLKEYFNKEREVFDLPLYFKGTSFQEKVWKELINIPYGKTVSYSYIAEKIGNSKGVRAVGGANNKNKIAIIIPCHRVIGKSGKLIGYAGGLDKKEYLLDLEKNKKG